MSSYVSDSSRPTDHESSLEPFHRRQSASGTLANQIKSSEGFISKIERNLTTLHQENNSLRERLAISERSRQEMCEMQNREKEALLRRINCEKECEKRMRQQKEAYSIRLEERITEIFAEKKEVEEFQADVGEQQIAALKKEVEAMISPYIWPK